MARFLFASIDFPAHADWGGFLDTAEHLRRAGHDVLWVTGARMAPRLAASGLATRVIPVVDPYRHGGHVERIGADCDRSPMVELWRFAFRASPATGTSIPERLARAYTRQVGVLADCWLQEEAVAASTDAILRIIEEWRPHVVLAEPMMLPAALAAEARGVTLCGCGWPGPVLTFQPVVEFEATASRITGAMDRLRRRVGLPARPAEAALDLFFASADQQIVYFPPDWYGALGARPAPHVTFVGRRRPEPMRAMSRTRTMRSRRRERPFVVLAAASSYVPAPETLRAMFEAVGRVGGIGVFGGCDELRAQLGDVPSHIRWQRWVDYDRVLPKADVIVHHGGLGTTHAAVRWATPQVVLPGIVDQIVHAEAIARSEAGETYVGPINADTIEPLLRRALSLPARRAAAERLRERFDAYGGVARAADLLIDLAARAA